MFQVVKGSPNLEMFKEWKVPGCTPAYMLKCLYVYCASNALVQGMTHEAQCRLRVEDEEGRGEVEAHKWQKVINMYI